MAIEDKFNLLKADLAQTLDLVQSRLSEGVREETIYKGTIVFLSKLIHHPPFMFVGINPGAGVFKDTGKKPRDLDPADDGFEYVLAENNYDYALARETRGVFAETKFKSHLENCVKTNLFYTCTSRASELCEFMDLVERNCGVNYWKKSVAWTKMMIDLIEPSAIICEGKFAIDRLASYYELQVQWRDEIGSFLIDGQIEVIGYKRRYSHIRNRDSLMKALNQMELPA